MSYVLTDPLGMNTCKWMLNILDGTAASCNIWPLLAYFWHLRSDAGVGWAIWGVAYIEDTGSSVKKCRSKSCHIWRVLASSWHVSEVTLERGERGDHTRVSAHLARLSLSIKTYDVYGCFFSRQYFSLNKIPRNYILHGSSNLFTIKICWDIKQKSQTNNLREHCQCHWRKDWIQGHQFVFSKNRRDIVESKEQGLRFEVTGLTSKHHPMCDHIRLFSTLPPHTSIAQWWCDVQRRCLRSWGSNFSRSDQLPALLQSQAASRLFPVLIFKESIEIMCLSQYIRKPFFNNVTRRGHILRGDKKSQVEARVSEAWLGKAKAPVGE